MDLHSGAPFWLVADGLQTVVPPIESDLRCDVVIIGSGITGALIADAMTREGLHVAVVDCRDLGRGSTGASTALLQYDIDIPLHRLATQIGWDRAARAYRLGAEAIDWITGASERLGCCVERRPSLYFVRRAKDRSIMQSEWEARRKAGFDVSLLGGQEVRDGWGLHADTAILSALGAQTDPYMLTHALLRAAMHAGAQVHDRTKVTSLRTTGRTVVAHTDRGPIIRARYVVNATGYESARHLPPGLVSLSSTYALISEPTEPPPGLWKDRCMMWEHADPYLYLRWVGDRVIVGGEDVAFTDEVRRDRLIGAKARTLRRICARLLPELPLETAFAWTGTFGSTRDGLGCIGPAPGHPRVLYAVGFGGNGITCSATAARLLTDLVLGRANPDLDLFRLDR